VLKTNFTGALAPGAPVVPTPGSVWMCERVWVWEGHTIQPSQPTVSHTILWHATASVQPITVLTDDTFQEPFLIWCDKCIHNHSI